MKLDEFVSQTLTAIMQGVRRAQEQTADLGGVVSPQMFKVTDDENIGLAFGHSQPVINVSFDVVVSTTDKSESQGGLGVFVGPIGVGSKGASGLEQGSESRIQFKVPVVLPYKKVS
jgi:hypothetical protein